MFYGIIIVMTEFHSAMTAVKAESLISANFISQNIYIYKMAYDSNKVRFVQPEFATSFFGNIKIKEMLLCYNSCYNEKMKRWLPH